MSEIREPPRPPSRWLPTLSMVLGMISFAILTVFLVVAFVRRSSPDIFGVVADLGGATISFSQKMGFALSSTFGGIGGFLFRATAICALGALFSGLLATRRTRPSTERRARTGLWLSSLSVLLIVVVVFFVGASSNTFFNVVNLIK